MTTYDVIAVELGSKRVTVIAEAKPDEQARTSAHQWQLGVAAIARFLGRPEHRFYTTAEAGKYRDGDTYGGAK